MLDRDSLTIGEAAAEAARLGHAELGSAYIITTVAPRLGLQTSFFAGKRVVARGELRRWLAEQAKPARLAAVKTNDDDADELLNTRQALDFIRAHGFPSAQAVDLIGPMVMKRFPSTKKNGHSFVRRKDLREWLKNRNSESKAVR